MLEQLSDYLDDDARAELCKAIEAHMKGCPDCKVYVDSVRKTIVLYQAGSKMETPIRISAQLQAALANVYAKTGTRD